MLLEFEFENFKTFKDKTVFSMMPAPKIKDLEYSVLKKKISKKSYKGLSSAVVYGPNAAGKTNIISAMRTFKNIVLKGNILNDDYAAVSSTETTRNLELIPNISLEDTMPVKFSIKFIEGNLLFHYMLGIDLGTFLSNNYNRRIVNESLFINEKMVFDRNEDTIVIGDVNIISDMLILAFDKSVSEKISQSNLNDTELFLTGLFKSLYSSQIVSMITKWFQDKFKALLSVNFITTEPYVDSSDDTKIIMDKTLNDAIKHFGIHGNSIAYIKSENNKTIRPFSLLPDGNAIPVEVFESYGTKRFLDVFPLVLDTLQSGATLVVDDFDASLHPMALMSIVGAFHNDEINKHGAQLIFSTHNPIFLNRNLFRRDEIKFVDRNDETGISNCYSLSDFGTSGPNGVRNTEDYMKNYFISRYGSIRNIDFSDILKERMESVENEEKD